MYFSFDSEVAKVVGVDGAIMLNNMYYWIAKNRANDKHYYENTYWTYNTINALTELFPFWSKKQISRILNKLIEDGYLSTGNFNKVSYDRTKWYTLTEKGYSIFPNGEIELPKKENRIDQKGNTIPNNIPNNINSANDDLINDEKVVDKIWSLYPNKKGRAQAIKKIPKIISSIGESQLIRCIERYSLECKGKDKQFILNGSTFFNGRYEDYLDCNFTDEKTENKEEIKPKENKYKFILEDM